MGCYVASGPFHVPKLILASHAWRNPPPIATLAKLQSETPIGAKTRAVLGEIRENRVICSFSRPFQLFQGQLCVILGLNKDND